MGSRARLSRSRQLASVWLWCSTNRYRTQRITVTDGLRQISELFRQAIGKPIERAPSQGVSPTRTGKRFNVAGCTGPCLSTANQVRCEAGAVNFARADLFAACSASLLGNLCDSAFKFRCSALVAAVPHCGFCTFSRPSFRPPDPSSLFLQILFPRKPAHRPPEPASARNPPPPPSARSLRAHCSC